MTLVSATFVLLIGIGLRRLDSVMSHQHGLIYSLSSVVGNMVSGRFMRSIADAEPPSPTSWLHARDSSIMAAQSVVWMTLKLGLAFSSLHNIELATFSIFLHL
ncbi:hypothetical protein Tdes44962_MAKER07230 [Teratosphaeria destructans]|uniref:Uncharacterized protein n=1 Tax=Teratosphaeria destructans TaxID=418781 RepID=A0A9W7SZQ3_9PEZI|nr:hypothetical protein Tdes44962_MAKER07230 [Teratosphaeria destructans]